MDPKVIIENLGILSFNEECVPKIKERISLVEGVIAFLIFIFALLLILPPSPLTVGRIAGAAVAKAVVVILVRKGVILLFGFLIAATLSYYIAKIFRTKVKFSEYLKTVFGIIMFSAIALVILLILMIVVLKLVPAAKGAISFIALIIPFYSILAFAWACEMGSELKGGKSILVAGTALIIAALFVSLVTFVM